MQEQVLEARCCLILARLMFFRPNCSDSIGALSALPALNRGPLGPLVTASGRKRALGLAADLDSRPRPCCAITLFIPL